MKEHLIRLSKKNLRLIKGTDKLNDALFQLPEKVLQFGTGVLLRGLPDYFIDKANKENIFNGRITVVKSTVGKGVDYSREQDYLFTHCLRGYINGVLKSDNIINYSISRILEASCDWESVLKCAANPELKIIISNTTEVGIVLNPTDKINNKIAPFSFPCKLLTFLYERYKIFSGAFEAGMVIIPTELIPDNRKTLLQICLQLAAIHHLGDAFYKWLQEANDFCNSLVDRIVPGKPSGKDAEELKEEIGYDDDLLIMSETYGLWAIETSKDTTRNILSFAHIHTGIIVCDDIEKYKRLKLYLLNATYTFTCLQAIMRGFIYVNESLMESDFEQYAKRLMFNESVKVIIGKNILENEAEDFAINVLDRFKNPFIHHKWTDIARQITLKMRTRCIPLISAYYRKFNELPTLMTECFANYLLFTKKIKNEDDGFVVYINDKKFRWEEDKADILHNYWITNNDEEVVEAILSDISLWGEDLRALKGIEAVIKEVFANQMTE